IDFRTDNANHARLALQCTDVVDGEENSPSGPLAARLDGRAAAPHDGDVPPQLLEHVLIAASESFAGGRQDDDRDHAPQDPEHRQEAAKLVGAEILEHLNDGFAHTNTGADLTAGPYPGRTT